MRIRGMLHGALVAALGVTASGGAFASACSGPSPFTDIPQSAIYCTDAAWLANRGITLGCGGTSFCPADVVTRGSMALFMQRLGTALTPTFLTVDVATADINLDVPTIVCQTPDFTPTGHPRTARITTTFTGFATAALQYTHQVYVSTNGGVSWTFTNANVNRNGATSNHWVSSSTEYIQSLAVGTTYRWGVRLAREPFGPGAGNFEIPECSINVEIRSRTGASSPFDSAVTSTVNDH